MLGQRTQPETKSRSDHYKHGLVVARFQSLFFLHSWKAIFIGFLIHFTQITNSEGLCYWFCYIVSLACLDNCLPALHVPLDSTFSLSYPNYVPLPLESVSISPSLFSASPYPLVSVPHLGTKPPQLPENIGEDRRLKRPVHSSWIPQLLWVMCEDG